MAMESVPSSSFDDDLFPHAEKPTATAMEIDTVVSAHAHAYIEERKAAVVEQQKLLAELQASAIASMQNKDLHQAEEIFRHLLHHQQAASDDNAIIVTLANIGKCCQLTGRLSEAMSCYKEALQMKACPLHQEPLSVKLLLASILYDIGMIHAKQLFAMGTTATESSRRGELVTKAIKAFALTLKLRQASLGEQNPAVASTLHNMGAVLTAAGNPEAAGSYLLKALAIRRVVLGPKHPEVASSLRHLATCQKALGNYQDAAGYLSQALEILRGIPGEVFLREVMIDLSHVKRAMNEK